MTNFMPFTVCLMEFETGWGGTNSLLTDDCGEAPLFTTLHILAVLAVNVIALLVIFYGSAVMFFIASAVSIPLTSISKL